MQIQHIVQRKVAGRWPFIHPSYHLTCEHCVNQTGLVQLLLESVMFDDVLLNLLYKNVLLEPLYKLVWPKEKKKVNTRLPSSHTCNSVDQ